MKKESRPFYTDIWLFVGILSLMGISLMVLYSASGVPIMLKQSYRFLFGLSIFFIMLFIPKRLIIFSAPVVYLLTVMLLVGVFFFGIEVNNSKRWLDVGIRIQPSEFAKLTVPLMVAFLFVNKHLKPSFFKIVFSILIVIIPGSLIFIQPDLGTSMLVMSSGLVILFFAGLSWRVIGFFLLFLSISIPIYWNYGIEDYQKDRVLTLINPEADPLGKGYQIIQSKIAIGSGMFSGKGYMQGTQSKLEFLPEYNTDFIFAVFAEEFGFTGVLGLLMLYFFVLLRLCILSIRVKDNFSRLLIASASFIIFIYFIINMAMVMGIFPVVGLPLPLISYGGSSIVSITLMLGVVMRLSREDKIIQLKKKNPWDIIDNYNQIILKK